MFTLVYLLGWLGTAAFVVRLWTQRRPGGSGRPSVPAVVVGLVVGLFWPITLWIVGGVWWRRRAASTPGAAAPPVRLPSLGGTVAVCAVGSIMTVAALGAAAPPRAPSTTPSSFAGAEAPTTTATATALPVAVSAALLVVGVVDGDTVDLSDGRRVRLLGIDAPEKGDCGYREATEFARTSLLDRPVQVAPDPTQAETDQNERALLYVGAPQDYSIAAAGAGWAEHYVFDRKPVQKAPQIEAAERTAKAQRLGIWGILCAPAPTSAPATTRQAPPAAQDDDDRVAAAPRTQPRSEPEPPPAPRPAPAPEPEPEPESESDCHPSYVPCVPNGPDLDCGEIGFAVRVVGPDEYRLDGNDNDGKGCESYG